MQISKNDIKIDYNEDFINVVRKHLGRKSDEIITEQEMVDFFKSAFSNAVDKGVGVVEE